jgi:hypothetical protein
LGYYPGRGGVRSILRSKRVRALFSLSSAVLACIVPGTSILPCGHFDASEIRNVGHGSEIVKSIVGEISD